MLAAAGRIRSNVDVHELFKYSETGFLELVLNELFTYPEMQGRIVYVYFKRTTDTTIDINPEELNRDMMLFIVGDESNYLPVQFSEYTVAIFKTYLQTFNHTCGNLFHLPIGCNNKTSERPLKQFSNRSTNVFFSGNLHTGRNRIYGFLSGWAFLPFPLLHRLRRVLGETFHNRYPESYIAFTRRFTTGMNPDAYSDKLSDSKIVLCPPGNPGIETMRHFEAMRAGCIIITEKLPPADCYQNSPLIVVDTWKEADSIIRNLLRDTSKSEEIHKAMVRWWSDRCSPKATAKYIIEKLNSVSTPK